MTVTYSYTYRDDGTIEKVLVTNTAEGREEPDAKEITFTKIWRDYLGENNLAWPAAEITVTVKQDGEVYGCYTITQNDLAVGTEIGAVGDASKQKLKVIAADAETGYVFRLSGLDYDSTFTVSEEQVSGYQTPKYFSSDGEQEMGASETGDNGIIKNDQMRYELPHTGGRGNGNVHTCRCGNDSDIRNGGPAEKTCMDLNDLKQVF